MKKLTAKEEEIMTFFWDNGPQFVKQIHDTYQEPKPHYNTLSTIVRGLEEKGFIGHTAYGNTYQYHALLSREDYRNSSIKGLIGKYFDNSYRHLVSSFIEEEELSIDELKSLIREVEEKHKHKHKHKKT
ncbi:MAG: BlaI/MecI/CopY family transcriptional regulator [Tannerella sp.]|jgi:predicted transcriptional regulator|nr:BlaI/MecI/CopY family transcriptional regulator [Tannerella sp.]